MNFDKAILQRLVIVAALGILSQPLEAIESCVPEGDERNLAHDSTNALIDEYKERHILVQMLTIGDLVCAFGKPHYRFEIETVNQHDEYGVPIDKILLDTNALPGETVIVYGQVWSNTDASALIFVFTREGSARHLTHYNNITRSAHTVSSTLEPDGSARVFKNDYQF